jgi:hypothetical protein
MFGESDLKAFHEWRASQLANEVSVLRREFSPDVKWVLSRVLSDPSDLASPAATASVLENAAADRLALQVEVGLAPMRDREPETAFPLDSVYLDARTRIVPSAHGFQSSSL